MTKKEKFWGLEMDEFPPYFRREHYVRKIAETTAKKREQALREARQRVWKKLNGPSKSLMLECLST